MSASPFTENLIAGVNYLASEANNNGYDKCGRILRICLRDLCIALEHNSQNDNATSSASDADLYHIINFLTHFSSADKATQQAFVEFLESSEKAAAVS